RRTVFPSGASCVLQPQWREYNALLRVVAFHAGEVKIERSEAQLGLHLDHHAAIVVGEPDLRLATFTEDSAGPDDRLNHDSLEGAGRNRDRLPAKHPYAHGVSVGAEVAVERVRSAGDQRYRTHEVQEGAIVQRLCYGRLLLLAPQLVGCPVREDLPVTLALTSALLVILNVAKGVERLHVHPAVQPVVHLVKGNAALNAEEDVVGFVAANVLDALNLHEAVAHLDAAELHIVGELFAHRPGHTHLSFGTRNRQKHGGGKQCSSSGYHDVPCGSAR